MQREIGGMKYKERGGIKRESNSDKNISNKQEQCIQHKHTDHCVTDPLNVHPAHKVSYIVQDSFLHHHRPCKFNGPQCRMSLKYPTVQFSHSQPLALRIGINYTAVCFHQ